MTSQAIEKADDFINNEKEYHLGFLPVEQANPKTRHLDADFAESEERGISALFSVDHELLELVENALKSQEFAKLTESFYRTLINENKIIFSGCGASGRLCILLESAYRNLFKSIRHENPETYSVLSVYSDQVFSIMTGGDYALVRSVENFEDYFEPAQRQAQELNPGKGDLLVGITATGETTSILGTVDYALSCGADAFFIISVRKEIPEERLQRVRKIYAHPNMTVFDMPCVPMAIAGSTRMQATTLEQVVIGAALETAVKRLVEEKSKTSGTVWNLKFPTVDYYHAFGQLIYTLQNKESLTAIANVIRLEEQIYRRNGLITYYADDLLLDIITDTTERSPTFSLPPFRKNDDYESAQSWAFAKNPSLDTRSSWLKVLGRKPRCINWTSEDYLQMEISESVAANPPKISAIELMKFTIGNEAVPCRYEKVENAAILIGNEKNMPIKDFEKNAEFYQSKKILYLGNSSCSKADFVIPYSAPSTPLRLFEHLAAKLVMNIISTGVMVKMKRTTGNWMSFLDISNKKLIDRGIRIIADQCDLSYRDAAIELFSSIEELKGVTLQKACSPVQYTIEMVKKHKYNG